MVVRRVLCFLWAVLLGCGIALADSQPAGGDQAQLANLLLVTLDTLRADHLGAYGYPRPTSPSLDRFATTATRFEDVTCSMPTTLPSHLTILTGLMPTQHGVMTNGVVPPGNLLSIFDLLAARGHRTAAVVAAKVLAPTYLGGLGLDQIYYGDGRTPWATMLPARSVTTMAGRWLEAFGEEPFALWLHYYDPHEPYDPPPEFAARFIRDARSRIGSVMSTKHLHELNDDPRKRAELSERDRRHIVDLSNAELASMDQQLGRLLRILKRRGLLERTVIVIVGDHGQAHGEHDYWGHGRLLLEPVVKVPMLIRLPGQDRGQQVVDAVETLDIMPTLCELFGFEEPPGLSGRSLVPLLRGDPVPALPFRVVIRRHFAGQPHDMGMAVYGDDWKLTVYRDQDSDSMRLGRKGAEGGLDGDLGVGPESSELLLVNRLVALTGDRTTPVQEPDRSTLEMLRALGYVQ